MPTITIDVEDTTFAKLGAGPITSAYDVGWDDPVSMCGTFSFKVPARDQRSALLAVQTTVCRFYVDGNERFLGLVEQITREIPETGSAVFVVEGRSFLADLEKQVLGSSVGSDFAQIGDNIGTPSATGVTDAPNDVMAYNSIFGLAGTWSLDTTNGSGTTAKKVYAQFRGENRLNALIKIAEFTGEHFIYRPWLANSADRKVIWIGDATTASGVRAIQGGGDAVELEGNDDVCLIVNLDELEDGGTYYNQVRVYGAGDDLKFNALSLASATVDGTEGTDGQPDRMQFSNASSAVSYLYSVDDTNGNLGLPKREAIVQFPNITPLSNTDADQTAAANLLQDTIRKWLPRHGYPHKFYRLTVAKLPATVQPGQTLNVIYYEEDTDGTVLHDIDLNLVILNIKWRFGNDGSVLYSLDVSTTDRFPTGSSEIVASRIETSKIYQSHTQLSASLDTNNFAEDFDHEFDTLFPFWLGPEMAQVQQVFMRFRVDPLRSTVKSISGGASTQSATISTDSHTHTVAMNNHTHSVPMANHDHAVPNHIHYINIGQAATVPFYNVGYSAAGPAGGLVHDNAAGAAFNVPTNNSGGTTTTTIGGTAESSQGGGGTAETIVGENTHTHGIAHTHTTTNAYGIYKDATSAVIGTGSAPALMEDITIEINGNEIHDSDVSLDSGGYFKCDLSNLTNTGYDLVDSDTFRPASAYNTVEFLAHVHLSHGSVTNGPFVVGETVTGSNSSATGVIKFVGSGYIMVKYVSGTFENSEQITGDDGAPNAYAITNAEPIYHQGRVTAQILVRSLVQAVANISS